jgi:hypothetical protein
MKKHTNKIGRWIVIAIVMAMTVSVEAQETDNVFTIDAKMLTRGELMTGR